MYHADNLASTYSLYQEKKSGVLSTFPFGIFGYARLDDRLADSELWNSSPREPGRDPLGLTPSQPQVEFWNSELYGGPKQLVDFPGNEQYAFGMWTLLFGQKSRGNVTLKSKDPLDNPVVDHKYLDHPLDRLVLTEAVRFANDIALKGAATKDIIKGSWPASAKHGEYATREDWEPYVKDVTTTCECTIFQSGRESKLTSAI